MAELFTPYALDNGGAVDSDFLVGWLYGEMLCNGTITVTAWNDAISRAIEFHRNTQTEMNSHGMD